MSRMCRAPCVNHMSHLWFSGQVQVQSGASDKVSGAPPARLGQANCFKLCERQRQWRATHAPRPNQVAEVVQETTEPICRRTRAASPNSLVLCTSAFLDNFIFCPCASMCFASHLLHVEVWDVPFIADMRVIALLNRAIGCESFQPLLDRILRLPFAAVDLDDDSKIEPARHGLFCALSTPDGRSPLHPMREVSLARCATSLLHASTKSDIRNHPSPWTSKVRSTFCDPLLPELFSRHWFLQRMLCTSNVRKHTNEKLWRFRQQWLRIKYRDV